MNGAQIRGLALWVVGTLVLTTSARATFHLMQIEQVIGGVNDDPSAQAIQLRMRSSFQNLVSGARLVTYDAAGLNPVIVIDMTNNVANSSAGDRVLIVSTNFANYSSPVMAADFRMTNLIPTNYLTAGRLTWEDDFGTILWSLSWGGTNYTGPVTVSTLNDDNGTNTPAFNGPLPTSSTRSLLFTNTASALSRSNIVDYVITPGSAVFTNNARARFVVVPAPVMLTFTNEGNDVRVPWTAAGGRSYVLEAVSGDIANGFTNITGTITVPGVGPTTTNALDVGGWTNSARFYRVRLLP